MRPLTATTPKPLLKVGGRALIEYLIEQLKNAGFTELVINHAWLGEQVEAALGDGSKFGVSITYSAEGEPLNTAGGIIKALPLLGDDPFLVVNGDVWTDFPFTQLKSFAAMEQLAHLVLVDNPTQHPDGDYVLDAAGKLNMPKHSQFAKDTLTYSGIAVLHPRLFVNLAIEKRPLAELFERAIGQAKISGEHYMGEWSDIGTVDRLQALDASLG